MASSASTLDVSSIVEALLSAPGFSDAIRKAVAGEGVKLDASGEKVEVVGEGDDGAAPVVGEVENAERREETGEASVASWADEMSSASEGSVEIVGPGVSVSEEVRKSVKFGGIRDEFIPVDSSVISDGGGIQDGKFMKSCVRAPHVLKLRQFVSERAGVKLPKATMIQFALCTYAAATVPDGFQEGKRKLRQMESVGDAAIALAIIAKRVAAGDAVESVQAAKAKYASNAMLSLIAVNSGYMENVVVPSGVELRTAKTSANALEAMVGYLMLYRGFSAVVTFLQSMQLL